MASPNFNLDMRFVFLLMVTKNKKIFKNKYIMFAYIFQGYYCIKYYLKFTKQISEK